MIIKEDEILKGAIIRDVDPFHANDPPPKYEPTSTDAEAGNRIEEGSSSICQASRRGHSRRKRHICVLFASTVVLSFVFVHLIRLLQNLARDCLPKFNYVRKPDQQPTREVHWRRCAPSISRRDFECANITVPLDYHSYGTTDNRTAVIAVTKRLATNPNKKVGSLFLNPGGPGGSGTIFAYRRGEQIDKVLKGRYDLIGFDPRGINHSFPFTQCFDSAFGYELYSAQDYRSAFNLPTNLSLFPNAESDLARQVDFTTAGFIAGARQCAEKTGDLLAYAGTEAVVRDIEYMSRLIDGEDARVNFWGFSYGTVIGSYLVQILPRERIGRIAIDGVVNVEHWNTALEDIVSGAEGLNNIDDVTRSFAESCISAGEYCELSYMSAEQILAQIDSTIDFLYQSPQPVNGLINAPGVGVATASSLRSFIFNNAYRIAFWPDTAKHLAQVFKGNYMGLLNRTFDVVDPADVNQKDGGNFAVYAIACADVKPPSADFNTTALASSILQSMHDYSFRNGDGFWSLGLCGFWPIPSKSRFDGPFGLPDGSLDTPMLIISNTYDPVTSLRSGYAAKERLGMNARLVQQDGWGHCSVSQTSYCTADKVRRFFVEGEVPEANHTFCPVDEHPFIPFDPKRAADQLIGTSSVSVAEVRDAAELMQAWNELGEGFAPPGRGRRPRDLW